MSMNEESRFHQHVNDVQALLLKQEKSYMDAQSDMHAVLESAMSEMLAGLNAARDERAAHHAASTEQISMLVDSMYALRERTQEQITTLYDWMRPLVNKAHQQDSKLDGIAAKFDEYFAMSDMRLDDLDRRVAALEAFQVQQLIGGV